MNKKQTTFSLLSSKLLALCPLLLCLCFLPACQTTKGNAGRIQNYPLLSTEAEWIRHGEPIEFEGNLWYPADGVESLTDSEVYILGEYRGVQYFADKVDVRPYERLYTKFDKNKFRYFKKKDHDQN